MTLDPQYRQHNELSRFISGLNRQFGLEIPFPGLQSLSVVHDKSSLRWRSFVRLRFLYFQNPTQLDRAVNSLAEWIAGQPSPATGSSTLSDRDKDERMMFLFREIEDDVYLLSRGSPGTLNLSHPCNPTLDDHGLDHDDDVPMLSPTPCKRPFSDGDEEEFHTAPNSPSKSQGHIHGDRDLQDLFAFTIEPAQSPSAPPTNLNTPSLPQFRCTDAQTPFADRLDTSFSTPASSIFLDRSTIDHSFQTEITEPDGTQSSYPESFVDLLPDILQVDGPNDVQQVFQNQVAQELVHHGPFTLSHPFPGNMPLRYRYEFERLGRAWNIPLQRIYRGNSASWRTQDDFWTWVQNHNQRFDQPLPERSQRRAWDYALHNFKTDTPSEVVILTGEFHWSLPGEQGIFKLILNPLKCERTCRFHRRFGSDRFLSVTMPAPSRPPNHLMCNESPFALRDAIAWWLTQNDHQCLGRTWRPFYVEEVKSKRKAKAEPRFRIDFFAIDGVDFRHQEACDIPSITPALRTSDSHSPMTVGDLLEWHMPHDLNSRQSNCKLFQRLSLGLSKTLASVVLHPTQIVRLRDRPNWKMVMNDGCALMSRALALKICDSIGITGPTPSCFQARIAGAKGLWMVDRHQSNIRSFINGDDVWLQVSDSQLKIYPHPQELGDNFDPEQLTFEVVSWAKPLHPVNLNPQLLAILDHGGNVKEHLAKLTRDGIDELYDDFAHVFRSNNPLLCRSLLQKLRPSGEDGTNKLRRLEQFVANETEFIIRLCEAGFPPRTFWPLRKRLGQMMRRMLERHVEELRIQVPLSTYAYCIADPYDILEPNEVHFGFSTRWSDPNRQFEDTHLEEMDVLVGRLPTHVPSDIQRRKAVWKPELRHFQDIIVFSSKGNIPLAHMLSGGDYDGDTPWICWDPHIVQSFQNSPLPESEFPADYFGLSKHSKPMNEVDSTSVFLQSTFEFNLTLSSLGICTVEHEKITYDESINSSKAIELASLLSHLVDGRKGGVHLSEKAWLVYLKTVSPRQRALPAYRNPGRKPKMTNIVDYLKFQIAQGHAHSIREKLEKEFPEDQGSGHIDEDLSRPIRQAWEAARLNGTRGGELDQILQQVQSTLDKLIGQWNQAFRNEPETFPVEARQAIESAASLPPPRLGSHPLLYTWQNSPVEWQRLLASCAYTTRCQSSFIFHAFGETLCRLKGDAVPSRMVTHDILACYRMDQKMVALLSEPGLPTEGEEVDEYEGGEAIESFLLGADGNNFDVHSSVQEIM